MNSSVNLSNFSNSSSASVLDSYWLVFKCLFEFLILGFFGCNCSSVGSFLVLKKLVNVLIMGFDGILFVWKS